MPAVLNWSTHTPWVRKPLNGGSRTTNGSIAVMTAMPTMIEMDRCLPE